ncbi:MAG: hypothetical protein J5883_06720, partial [Clostridiales bacterium]|nr:hypothetical protein [Clostridiales bacterium]
MNKEKKIGIYFLIGVLALESFFIVFFNLTQLQYHLGHDTSVYLFQTIESWRQKSLLLEQWEYQTTFAIDSPVILAVFFYGICGN